MKHRPDKKGHFGPYGGRYVPETLMPALIELERSFVKAVKDKTFQDEYESLLREYVGRPSPLYFARRLSSIYGNAKIFLKREDLNHTGAHKINNTIGQALLAKRVGKTRLIAETGAGQHGVATATAAALGDSKEQTVNGPGKRQTIAPAETRARMPQVRLRPLPRALHPPCARWPAASSPRMPLLRAAHDDL